MPRRHGRCPAAARWAAALLRRLACADRVARAPGSAAGARTARRGGHARPRGQAEAAGYGDQLRGTGQDQRTLPPRPARRSGHRQRLYRAARGGEVSAGTFCVVMARSWRTDPRVTNIAPTGFPAHLTTSIDPALPVQMSRRSLPARQDGSVQCDAGTQRGAGREPGRWLVARRGGQPRSCPGDPGRHLPGRERRQPGGSRVGAAMSWMTWPRWW